MALPTFRNEDEEAQHCLSALRDGTKEQKIVARERLAAIFARRGLYEEAAELYELNVRAGVRSPEIVERLSEIYRQLGDHASAEAALAEARRLRAASAAPSGPAFPATDDGRSASAAHPAEAVADPDLVDDQDARAARADTARLPVQEHPPELTPLPEIAQPGRAHRAVPGPLLVVGLVLFLIVLPVALLALLVVNPLSLYLEGRAAGPLVDARATETPSLKVAPGTSTTWYLVTGRSVSGLWATPGLELSLAQEVDGAGSTFGVTAPRSQTWGETITIVERRGQGRSNQETVVPATFVAPATLPSAGTVLEGRIAGQVTAPRLTENSQFNTTTQTVDLPVRLVVVSTYDLWVDQFWNALRMFFDEDRWLLVTIGAILSWCVLAGGAAILFRMRRP